MWPKVRSGEKLRIPAGAYNALLDSLGRQVGGEANGRKLETPIEVLVRNDTGANLDDSTIVAIGQPITPPSENLSKFKSRHMFSGGSPTANSVIGVLVTALPDSSIGRAVVGGLAKVKVNITDSTHGYANSTTSTTQLTSGVTGSHRIVWKESGTGVKWAVINLGSFSPVSYTPTIAAYSTMGIINLDDQSLGQGRKTVQRLGIGYVDAVTPACLLDSEENRYNTSPTPSDGMFVDPSKSPHRLATNNLRVADTIDFGNPINGTSGAARIQAQTVSLGSGNFQTLGVAIPSLFCGAICPSNGILTHPTTGATQPTRSWIYGGFDAGGRASIIFQADNGFDSTLGYRMIWEYSKLTVQGGISCTNNGIVDAWGLQCRWGLTIGVPGGPDVFVRVANGNALGHPDGQYDFGITGTYLGIRFRDGIAVQYTSTGINVATETTGNLPASRISGTIDLPTQSSGNLDGSRISGTVNGANVAGVQCGSNTITFNEGSR